MFIRSGEALCHARGSYRPLPAPRQLEHRVRVLLHSRTHLEEQPAQRLVAQQVAALAVLVEQRLALPVREAAPHPLQHPHEALEVDQPLLLQVQELEGQRRPQPLVLLLLRPLPHPLEHRHLQLQQPLVGHSALEQPEAVDQQVHVELLALQRHAGVHVLEVLRELLVGEVQPVVGPVAQPLLHVLLALLRLLAQAAHVRVPLRPQAAHQRSDPHRPALLELLEGVVDGRVPLRRHVVPDVVDELPVGDGGARGEGVPDGADLLGGEEDSGSVEEQVEGVLGEAASAAGVELGHLQVQLQQVLELAAEELELEFVIDLGEGVYPVHRKLQLLDYSNAIDAIPRAPYPFVTLVLESDKLIQSLYSCQSAMKWPLSLLVLLIELSRPQIALPSNLTLLAATDPSLALDGKLPRAASYILQSHPELENQTIMEVTASGAVNDTLTDYFITLHNNNSTLLVAVSMAPNISSFFLSFTTLTPSPSPTPTPAPPSPPAPTANTPQPPQATLGTQNSTPPSPPPPPRGSYLNILGGFRMLDNLNEPRYKAVMNFLRQLHPHIGNYQVAEVQYQVVSGTIFLLRLNGYDQQTVVAAKLYLSLAGVPRLVDFAVSCAGSPSFSCSDTAASQVYFGCEYAINTHRQLAGYRLDSILVSEQQGSDLSFMATFQSEELKLRAIAEVQASAAGVSLQAYYSYRYQ